MDEAEVRQLIASKIQAHERRVGFISGVIGTIWLLANVGVVYWVLTR
jgi:hypothetical protein